jgi:hypothetical protein
VLQQQYFQQQQQYFQQQQQYFQQQQQELEHEEIYFRPTACLLKGNTRRKSIMGYRNNSLF